MIIEDRGFNTNNVFINTTLTTYTFTDLEEFNNYSCIVAAATSVGVGPYSTPIEFTTLQDGKQNVSITNNFIQFQSKFLP